MTRPRPAALPPDLRDRLRRRWPLPVVCVVLVVGLVYLSSVLDGPHYLSRSTLELLSSGNSPGEEAVLAQGYVDYFDQPTTQDDLRRRAGVDPSVTLAARVAGGSPLLYLEATASSPQDARRAVVAVSAAFRAEIGRTLTAALTRSPASLATGAPSSLEVLQPDGETSEVTPDLARSLLSPVVTTAILSTLAVMLVPGRRRPDRPSARTP